MEAQEYEFADTQRDLDKLITTIEANRVRMQRSLETSKKLNAAIESSKSVSARAKSTIKRRPAREL